MEGGHAHTLGRGTSVMSPESPPSIATSPHAFPMSSVSSAVSHNNILSTESAAAPVSLSQQQQHQQQQQQQQQQQPFGGHHRGQQHLMEREMMQGMSPPHGATVAPMNGFLHGDGMSAFQSNHQEPGARAAVPPPMPPRN